MDIIIVMCLGIFVGHKFFPKKLKKRNEQLQLVCTLVLIFSMGVVLGQRDNFLHELSTLGFQSFIFFLFPTVFSTIFVYVLTKLFMEKNGKNEKNGKKGA